MQRRRKLDDRDVVRVLNPTAVSKVQELGNFPNPVSSTPGNLIFLKDIFAARIPAYVGATSPRSNDSLRKQAIMRKPRKLAMETLDSRQLLTSLAAGLPANFNDDGTVDAAGSTKAAWVSRLLPGSFNIDGVTAEVGYVIDVNGQGGYATG